jgi:hypothetical protein
MSGRVKVETRGYYKCYMIFQLFRTPSFYVIWDMLAQVAYVKTQIYIYIYRFLSNQVNLLISPGSAVAPRGHF